MRATKRSNAVSIPCLFSSGSPRHNGKHSLPTSCLRQSPLLHQGSLTTGEKNPQQQCNGHCPCDSICPARQLKQQLRSALVAGQWRGDTAITFPLFWRRSPVFFGRACTLSSSSPLSPSLISHLASVDVKQNGPEGHRAPKETRYIADFVL